MFRYSTIALICLCVLFTDQSKADDFVVFTHNSEKQSYIDLNGELRGRPDSGLRGFYIELVREIMHDVGVQKRTIFNVPFKRGYTAASQEPGYALFNVAYNETRAPNFKWVGPIWTFKDYLIQSAQSRKKLYNLEDARDQKVCVVRGNVHDQKLSALKFKKMVRMTRYSDCIRLVGRGDVDLTPSALTSLPDKLDDAGVSPEKVRLTDILVDRNEGYIVFSKQTSDQIIKDWQTALDTIKGDGRYQSLQKQHIQKSVLTFAK